MEKTIEIDGRPVTFRATAAIPRLYRLRFHRDIMQDMAFMRKEILKAQKEKKSVPVDILTLFENVAFLMAKHADPSLEANTVEEWLETFSSFSICFWVMRSPLPSSRLAAWAVWFMGFLFGQGRSTARAGCAAGRGGRGDRHQVPEAENLGEAASAPGLP